MSETPSPVELFQAPDISITAPAPDRGPRPIVIQRLVLQVDRVDKPDDLFVALRRLADEVEFAEGGDDA
jgi:hypothetical protein